MGLYIPRRINCGSDSLYLRTGNGSLLPLPDQRGQEPKQRTRAKRGFASRPERAARTSDTAVFVARAVLEDAGGSFRAGTRLSRSVEGKEQARIAEKASARQHTRRNNRGGAGRTGRLTCVENSRVKARAHISAAPDATDRTILEEMRLAEHGGESERAWPSSCQQSKALPGYDSVISLLWIKEQRTAKP
jgi:hypothetical protein